MLNPNGATIYSASYTELAYLVYDIVVTKAPKGKNVNKLWDQAYNALLLLEALEFPTRLDQDDANALYDCIVKNLNIYDTSNYPTPVLPPPVIINGGPAGGQGIQGVKGDTGGGTDFNIGTITVTTVADSFTVGSAYAARWDYIVNGVPQRAGTVVATWTEDGFNIGHNDISTPDVNGATTGITFDVVYTAGLIQFKAVVTSGTWAISGTRYFIPSFGTFLPFTTLLLSQGKIYIGNSSNVPVEQFMSGVITIATNGVTSFGAGVILNADINSSANIAVSKLASLALNKVVVSDAATGKLITANPTITEINYVAGVTSLIQTQFSGKQDTITGAATTITSANLTINRAIVSDGSGKIAVSATTATQLGYLSTTGSDVQTQLNGKQATITGAATTVTASNLTANKILGSDSGGKIYATTFDVSAVSTVSNTGTANEILKSDGTNVVGTTLFSSVSGDITLGSASLSGNRTISKARGSNVGTLVISGAAGILGSLVGDSVSISSGNGYSGGGSAAGGAINIITGTGFSGGLSGDLSLSTATGSIYINAYSGGTAPNGNMAMMVNASVNFQSGSRIIFLGNRNTAPTGNPSSGTFIYSDSGVLKQRSGAGDIGAFVQSATTDTVVVLTAKAVLDFPSTSANSESDLTVTVTGAVAGDPVWIGNVGTGFGLFTAFVTAADTVTVRFVNNHTISVDPASLTFRIIVFKGIA